MSAAIDRLLESLAEISDLGRARALLDWDAHTQMPPRGAAIRSEQLATLTRLRHQRLASDELGRLIDAAASEVGDAEPDSFEASLVRVTRREWERARRVPSELRAEIARVTSLAERAWERCRAEDDFAAFLPELERVIELEHRYVERFEVDHAYDALLDLYEPGMKTAELRPVMERLRAGSTELLAEIVAAGVELDTSCLHGGFDLATQAELARDVAELMPLERDSWRLDPTVHPFATGIGISDLRITTRFDRDYLGTAIWAVMHECGHATYQNGIDPKLERTPLCRSASLGFDESQSRLWENWVGRGRPFLAHLLGLLRKRFPDRFAEVDVEHLYRAANSVRPSLIRVEADEVTYNLHIALRFELELALFEDRLRPAELPEAWAELAREYLGIEVPSDAEGVLQDVHWAGGAFGYFPTYSLGNVVAGQVWDLARAALPDLDEQLAAGQLCPLRNLLAERIYRHGGKFESAELIERVTGGPLDPAPLLRQLREKLAPLYGIAATPG